MRRYEDVDIEVEVEKQAPDTEEVPHERPTPIAPSSDAALFEAALDKMPEPAQTSRRARRESKKNKKKGGFGGSPLADKLAQIDLELAKETPAHQARAESAKESAPVEETSRLIDETQTLPSSEPQGPWSDDDLFAKALDTMSPDDIYAGKYVGRVEGLPPAPEPATRGEAHDHEISSRRTKESEEEDDHTARERVAELREEALFAHAVGPVDTLSRRTKYYEPKPRPHDSYTPPSPYSDTSPDGLIAPALPKSGEGLHRVEKLDPEHRGILNRCRLWSRQHDLPILNVRGDSLEDAVRQLELFIHQSWKDGARFVRVVHGRGVQSEGGIPVLKPTVLQWLEGPGFRYVRGYAPELTSQRDYGSIIVALEVRSRER